MLTAGFKGEKVTCMSVQIYVKNHWAKHWLVATLMPSAKLTTDRVMQYSNQYLNCFNPIKESSGVNSRPKSANIVHDFVHINGVK